MYGRTREYQRLSEAHVIWIFALSLWPFNIPAGIAEGSVLDAITSKSFAKVNREKIENKMQKLIDDRRINDYFNQLLKEDIND